MTNILRHAGWILSAILALIFWIQGCNTNKQANDPLVCDTIKIQGDTSFSEIHDTIIKPVRIYAPRKELLETIDTFSVIRSYFSGRCYDDTIRSHDVTAVIHDSITGDTISHRKVWIENKRPWLMLPDKPARKIFAGGFAGCDPGSGKASAGVSLLYINRKEQGFEYRYDLLLHMHSIGFAWKISLKK